MQEKSESSGISKQLGQSGKSKGWSKNQRTLVYYNRNSKTKIISSLDKEQDNSKLQGCQDEKRNNNFKSITDIHKSCENLNKNFPQMKKQVFYKSCDDLNQNNDQAMKKGCFESGRDKEITFGRNDLSLKKSKKSSRSIKNIFKSFNDLLSAFKRTEYLSQSSDSSFEDITQQEGIKELSIFNCPLCKEAYTGKIFLCKSGHSLCEKCCDRTSICPTCASKMTNKRSLDLEAIIKEVMVKNLTDLSANYSCVHKGCKLKMNLDNYKLHKAECHFRTHTCQMAKSCSWKGSYDEILDHYQEKHPNNCQLSTLVKSLDIHFDFSDFRDTQLLTYVDGQLFYYKCYVNSKERKVFFIFQYIGNKKDAEDYTYEFEINRDLRKYKVNGYCVSDVEDCYRIFEDENCVCISFKNLRHYMDDDGIINARFRIMDVTKITSISKPGRRK